MMTKEESKHECLASLLIFIGGVLAGLNVFFWAFAFGWVF